jgi:hypothetical protein
LHSYFGHLYPTDDILAVASAERLFVINDTVNVCYTPYPLGIDGVIVDKVTGSEILGQGERDPPGGWKPFRIKLDSLVPVNMA